MQNSVVHCSIVWQPLTGKCCEHSSESFGHGTFLIRMMESINHSFLSKCVMHNRFFLFSCYICTYICAQYTCLSAYVLIYVQQVSTYMYMHAYIHRVVASI